MGWRVLVCDFEGQRETGNQLERILLEASDSRMEVSHATFFPAESEDAQRRLSTMLPRLKPQVTLMVMGPEALPGTSGILQQIGRATPGAAVIAVVDSCEPSSQIAELLHDGADDFMVQPFAPADVVSRVLRWLPNKQSDDERLGRLKAVFGLGQFVGESPAFLEVMQMLPSVARCQGSVLIWGETGTGKEVCARAVHYLSARASKPFIPVNCGAIPVELVENELFGHSAGAYTGANQSAGGLIEAANQGTLFLDEIDSLPLMAQVKLLRFL